MAVTFLITLEFAAWAEPVPILVEAATRPSGQWKAFPTRTIEQLADFAATVPEPKWSRFGGRTDRKAGATGFFRAGKIQGRWWLVDPDGFLFLHTGVVAVTPGLGSRNTREAFDRAFGTEQQWAEAAAAQLIEHGFNGAGAWSRNDLLRDASKRVPYTEIWDFMSAYGKERGGTHQQAGHTGYPDDCIFVFDPEFERFCDRHARQLAARKNDPWLVGHFSDNELPFKPGNLDSYLSLPPNDPGHRAALDWLKKRHGAATTPDQITDEDRRQFLGFVVDRYLRITTRAIRKYDPNHLCLGSRFQGAELKTEAVFRAAGKYLDVISINYYQAWTPSPKWMQNWEAWSGKPFLITEWYAKGMDSGLANTTGAGWTVETQRDRGLFYQNFALGLLESRACVGWHWFKYMDNDPSNLSTDPSNRDSNKGIVSFRFEPYPPLLDAMKQLNERVYSLADYFDRR